MGTSTWRLLAARIWRSRSARRASRVVRCSRRSWRRRAVRNPAVWRAAMARSTPRKISSQTISQCRPLRRMGDSEHAQLGAPGPRIGRDLRLARRDRLAGLDPTQGTPPAGTDRLPRWADAGTGPFADRKLHQPIFAGMIGDHCQRPVRPKCVPEFRQGTRQPAELVVHPDAHRLEQARELGRARPGAQDGPNGVHQIVAAGQWLAAAPAYDLTGEASRPALVSVVGEEPLQPV